MVIVNEAHPCRAEENGARGYDEVRTPILYDVELWRESGHWEKFTATHVHHRRRGRQMGLKTMNCPGHIQILQSQRRLVPRLPVRTPRPAVPTATRASGVLHGSPTRGEFTQDDAHIFCSEEERGGRYSDCLEPRSPTSTRYRARAALELLNQPREGGLGTDKQWDTPSGAGQRDAPARDGVRDRGGEGHVHGPKIDCT